MANYTSMYIKRAEDSVIAVDMPGDDMMQADMAPIATAMAAKVSAVAAIEQANATWQLLALAREQALAEVMARPKAANNRLDELEAWKDNYMEWLGGQIHELTTRLKALEDGRKVDVAAIVQLKIATAGVPGSIADINNWGTAILDRVQALEDQHNALVAKGASEHLARQNQSSEPSTAGTVTVATPNAPADPERQVNLLASLHMLLGEIDPYRPETFKYAASMVKVVELFFNTEPAPAAADSGTEDLANRLEREEMSDAPTGEEASQLEEDEAEYRRQQSQGLTRYDTDI